VDAQECEQGLLKTELRDDSRPPLTADGSRRNFCAWVAGRSALRTVAATVAKRDGKRGLCCTVWILSRREQRRPASYQWEKGGTFIAGRNAREVRPNERAGRRGSAHGTLSSSGSIGLLGAFPATALMRPSRLADSRSVAVSTGSRLSCGFADVLRWQRRKDCVLAAQHPAPEALAQHSIGEQNAKRENHILVREGVNKQPKAREFLKIHKKRHQRHRTG